MGVWHEYYKNEGITNLIHLKVRMGSLGSEFFTLLRAALNGDPIVEKVEWKSVYLLAQRQSLEGVIWPVVKEGKLPLDVAFQWAGMVEMIRGLNELQNKEAARLTRVFEEVGRRSAILKGQANARLYPDKLLRQPGDIDIWVDGGRGNVIEMLINLGLLNERPTITNVGKRNKATANNHHIHLPMTKDGVVVEVHFRPTSGNHCPWTNWRLQKWLKEEIGTVTKVKEGFCVPSTKFALVMQLSHIQRHFLGSGIGMRQICDYYLLLKNSTEEERGMVSGKIGWFGLRRTAGALMWLLGETLHLDKGLMICEPDAWRGELLLREVMDGGNFGHYALQDGIWRQWFASKVRHARLMRFDFREVVWMEVNYWKTIVKTLPERVRRRSLSMRVMN